MKIFFFVIGFALAFVYAIQVWLVCYLMFHGMYKTKKEVYENLVPVFLKLPLDTIRIFRNLK